MKTKGSVALHRLLQKWETCRGPCKYWRCFRYRYTWPKKGLRVTGWKNIPKHNKGLKNGSSEQNSIRQYLKILLSQVNLRKFVIRNLFGNLISYAIECGGIGGIEVNLAMVCLCKKKNMNSFFITIRPGSLSEMQRVCTIFVHMIQWRLRAWSKQAEFETYWTLSCRKLRIP